MTTLYVPLALAALGIVLRGAGFAFRKSIDGSAGRRALGATFAISSVLTPFFMGTVVGAIAAGNVPAEATATPSRAGSQPLPLLIGAMFVATGAYLAAVFLVGDARRAGDEEMERYFARRALGAAVGRRGASPAPASSPCTPKPATSSTGSPTEGLPLVILSGCSAASPCSPCSLRGGRRPPAPARGGAVVAVIWGWGVAQFPYLLPTSLSIDQAAAPRADADHHLHRLRRRRGPRPALARPALHAEPEGHRSR